MEQLAISGSSNIPSDLPTDKSTVYAALLELTRRHGRSKAGLHIDDEGNLIGGVIDAASEDGCLLHSAYTITRTDQDTVDLTTHDDLRFEPVDSELHLFGGTLIQLAKTQPVRPLTIWNIISDGELHQYTDNELRKSLPAHLHGRAEITPWVHGFDITIYLETGDTVLEPIESLDFPVDNTVLINNREYHATNIEGIHMDSLETEFIEYTIEGVVDALKSGNLLPPLTNDQTVTNRYHYPHGGFDTDTESNND